MNENGKIHETKETMVFISLLDMDSISTKEEEKEMNEGG